MVTEERLRLLFDRQRFSRNARLQRIIDEAMSDTSLMRIADEDMAGVAAAGDPDVLTEDPADPSEEP